MEMSPAASVEATLLYKSNDELTNLSIQTMW